MCDSNISNNKSNNQKIAFGEGVCKPNNSICEYARTPNDKARYLPCCPQPLISNTECVNNDKPRHASIHSYK